jgi:hypothetical protein
MIDYGFETDPGIKEQTYPFLSLRLPKRMWNTEYFKNAKLNRRKITAHIDTFKTWKHFFYMNKYGQILTEPNDPQVKKCRKEFFAKSIHKIRSRRGISLFEKIPYSRSCRDAMVPFQYCNCKDQTELTKNETVFVKEQNLRFKQIAIVLMDKLNALTDPVRSLCEPFKFVNVGRVHSFLYNNQKIYKFEIVTTPGKAVFEAHFTMPNRTDVELYGKIIRTSRYGDQSKCVADNDDYKEYCYCKKLWKKVKS